MICRNDSNNSYPRKVSLTYIILGDVDLRRYITLVGTVFIRKKKEKNKQNKVQSTHYTVA